MFFNKNDYTKTSMRKLTLFLLLLMPLRLFAEEDNLVFDIEIIENKFVPETLIVPANKKFVLRVKNSDSEAEEFESFDLKREKIIPPNATVEININPLDLGEYEFFGEFHIKTAQGKIIVKEK